MDLGTNPLVHTSTLENVRKLQRDNAQEMKATMDRIIDEDRAWTHSIMTICQMMNMIPSHTADTATTSPSSSALPSAHDEIIPDTSHDLQDDIDALARIATSRSVSSQVVARFRRIMTNPQFTLWDYLDRDGKIEHLIRLAAEGPCLHTVGQVTTMCNVCCDLRRCICTRWAFRS
jgi:hypothetical protein